MIPVSKNQPEFRGDFSSWGQAVCSREGFQRLTHPLPSPWRFAWSGCADQQKDELIGASGLGT